MKEICNSEIRAGAVFVQHTNGKWGRVMINPHFVPGTTCVRVVSDAPVDGWPVLRWRNRNIVARCTRRV